MQIVGNESPSEIEEYYRCELWHKANDGRYICVDRGQLISDLNEAEWQFERCFKEATSLDIGHIMERRLYSVFQDPDGDWIRGECEKFERFKIVLKEEIIEKSS